MIKINLLTEGKRPAAVRKAKAGAVVSRQDVALWMLFAGIMAGILAAVGYWWALSRELEAKQAEVAQAQKQVDALQAVIKEVEDFKKKKKALGDKIQVINDLKSNQRGPVKIMDYVSRALPELLWLDRMKMGATNIEIEGRAFNTNAVANFLENLDKVPEFKEPTLKDTTEGAGGVYRYTINFDFSFAASKKAESPAPGPATPAGPAAPSGALPAAPGSAAPGARPPAAAAAGGTPPAAGPLGAGSAPATARPAGTPAQPAVPTSR
ncbi:MAG TPA: PilN domain-containing protein [Thermoanaerobaculia bacterium]|nr:PilN domain-containing protein [Thermoanaerobaculia bacterium]